MRPDTQNHPIVPLMISLSPRGGDGADVEKIIVAEGMEVGQGTYRCRAYAPSGAKAQATVTIDDGFLRHDRVAQLFDVHGVGDLLIGRPPAREVRDSAWFPTICGWRDGHPVSPGGFDRRIHGDDGLLDALLPKSELESIQLWSRGGPSVVSTLPDQAAIYPVAAPAGSERNIRVAVLGGDVECAAYWAFFRNSVPAAAFELGKKLAARDAREDLERAVVVAHFIINFAIDDTSLAKLVADRLVSADQSSDAKVMLWALAFEGRWGDYQRDGQPLFNKAVNALFNQACLYTGTLRTFVERYASALPEDSAEATADPGLTEPIAWIRRLVMATFWDSDYLSYRASEPRNPDAKATDATVGRLAKKNLPASAEFVATLRHNLEASDIRPRVAEPTAAAETASTSVANENQPAGGNEAGRRRSRDRGRSSEGGPDRAAARGRGGRDARAQRDDQSEEELIEKLVHINRVSKTVKGGKRFGFAALVVVGDGKGRAGFGHGKAREVPEAILKATAEAKKKMIRVPLKDGRTLHHDGNGHFGAGRVTVRTAPAGTGIIAGGPMRAIFESLGVADVVTKSVGTSNPYNMIRATFEALSEQTSPKRVAQRRGKKIIDLLGHGRQAADVEDEAAGAAVME